MKWNAQGIISIRTFACKFFYKLLTKITIFFVSLRVSVFRKATDLKHATLPKMSPFSNFQEILIKFQNIYVALGGWIRIQTLNCLFGSFFAMIKPFFPPFYFQFSHNPIEQKLALHFEQYLYTYIYIIFTGKKILQMTCKQNLHSFLTL